MNILKQSTTEEPQVKTLEKQDLFRTTSLTRVLESRIMLDAAAFAQVADQVVVEGQTPISIDVSISDPNEITANGPAKIFINGDLDNIIDISAALGLTGVTLDFNTGLSAQLNIDGLAAGTTNAALSEAAVEALTFRFFVESVNATVEIFQQNNEGLFASSGEFSVFQRDNTLPDTTYSGPTAINVPFPSGGTLPLNAAAGVFATTDASSTAFGVSELRITANTPGNGAEADLDSADFLFFQEFTESFDGTTYIASWNDDTTLDSRLNAINLVNLTPGTTYTVSLLTRDVGGNLDPTPITYDIVVLEDAPGFNPVTTDLVAYSSPTSTFIIDTINIDPGGSSNLELDLTLNFPMDVIGINDVQATGFVSQTNLSATMSQWTGTAQNMVTAFNFLQIQELDGVSPGTQGTITLTVRDAVNPLLTTTQVFNLSVLALTPPDVVGDAAAAPVDVGTPIQLNYSSLAFTDESAITFDEAFFLRLDNVGGGGSVGGFVTDLTNQSLLFPDVQFSISSGQYQLRVPIYNDTNGDGITNPEERALNNLNTNIASQLLSAANATTFTPSVAGMFTITAQAEDQYNTFGSTFSTAAEAIAVPPSFDVPADVSVAAGTNVVFDQTNFIMNPANFGFPLDMTLDVPDGVATITVAPGSFGGAVNIIQVDPSTVLLTSFFDPITIFNMTTYTITIDPVDDAPANDLIAQFSITVDNDAEGLSTTENVQITWQGVGGGNTDATITGLTGTQTGTEDTAFDLSGQFSVTDPDGDDLTANFADSDGSFNATATAGVTITGNGTSNLTLVGNAAALNTLFASAFTYTPAENRNGIVPITYSVIDDGGQTELDEGTFDLDLAAVNDTPQVLVPANPLVGTEDIAAVFGPGAIAVQDVDNGDILTATLAATGAAVGSQFSVTAAAGAAVSGNNTDLLTIVGTVTAVNDTLDTFEWLGPQNAAGLLTADFSATDGTVSAQDALVIDLVPVIDLNYNFAAQAVDEPSDGSNFFVNIANNVLPENEGVDSDENADLRINTNSLQAQGLSLFDSIAAMFRADGDASDADGTVDGFYTVANYDNATNGLQITGPQADDAQNISVPVEFVTRDNSGGGAAGSIFGNFVVNVVERVALQQNGSSQDTQVDEETTNLQLSAIATAADLSKARDADDDYDYTIEVSSDPGNYFQGISVDGTFFGATALGGGNSIVTATIGSLDAIDFDLVELVFDILADVDAIDVNLTTTVRDAGGEDQNSFFYGPVEVLVTRSNAPPTLTITNDIENEQTAGTFVFQVSDPDLTNIAPESNTLSGTIVAPAGITFTNVTTVGASATVNPTTGNIEYGAIGSGTFTVDYISDDIVSDTNFIVNGTVTDGGFTVNGQGTLTILADNEAPIVMAPDQTTPEDTVGIYQIEFDDPNPGDTISGTITITGPDVSNLGIVTVADNFGNIFTLTGNVINYSGSSDFTMTIGYNPQANFNGGPFNLEIVATDGEATTNATGTITIGSVNDPAVQNPLPDEDIPAGQDRVFLVDSIAEDLIDAQPETADLFNYTLSTNNSQGAAAGAILGVDVGDLPPGFTITGNNTNEVLIAGALPSKQDFLDFLAAQNVEVIVTNTNFFGEFDVTHTYEQLNQAGTVLETISDNQNIDVILNEPPTMTIPSETFAEDLSSITQFVTVSDPNEDILNGTIVITGIDLSSATVNITLSGGLGSANIVGNLVTFNVTSGTQINLAIPLPSNFNGNINFNGSVSDGQLTGTGSGTATIGSSNDPGQANFAPVNFLGGDDEEFVQLDIQDDLDAIGESLDQIELQIQALEAQTAQFLLENAAPAGISTSGEGTDTLTFTGAIGLIPILNDFIANNNLIQRITDPNFTGQFDNQITYTQRNSNGDILEQITVSQPVNVVDPVNAVPTVTISGDCETDEDTPVTHTVAVTDDATASTGIITTDGNSTVTLSTVTGGTATQVSSTEISYTTTSATGFQLSYVTVPVNNFNGETIITVTADDQNGGMTQVTKSVMVDPVNDTPTFTLLDQVTNEDEQLTFAVTNIDDVEGNIIEMRLSVDSAAGTLSFVSVPVLVTVTGEGTSTVNAVGPKALLNDLYSAVIFTPLENVNGTFDLIGRVDDLNQSPQPVEEHFSILNVDLTINAINDAPTLSVEPLTIQEDGVGGLDVSVDDIDYNDSPSTFTITVSVANQDATLSLGSTPIGGATATINSPTMITVSGVSITDVEDTANLIDVSPVANFNGNFTLTVTADDGGSTGAPGFSSASEDITVNVIAVNDAPNISGPTTEVTLEDVPVTLAAYIASDVDGPSAAVTISVLNGIATVNPASGVTPTGNGTNLLSFTENFAEINLALADLEFTPDADFNGQAEILITINDLGQTGDPGPLSAAITTIIDVTPVGDPIIFDPIFDNIVFNINEDSTATAISNDIILIDPDGLNPNVTLAFGANDGTFSETGAAANGLTVSGDGTNNFSVTGDLNNVANFLTATVFYTPNSDFNGTDTITVTVTEPDGTTMGTFDINVAPVNDAPTIDTLDDLTGNEDELIDVNLAVSDLDGDVLTATLSVTNGVLLVDGMEASSVTITDTAAAINAKMIQYRGNENFNGADTLTVDLTDNTDTVSDTANITVDAVNDAPVFTMLPGATIETDVDTAVTITTIQVDDPDGNVLADLMLDTLNGTLTLLDTTNLTVVDNGTAGVMATGLISDLNAALSIGVQYTPNAGFSGEDMLAVTINDMGNIGGDPLEAMAMVTLQVNDDVPDEDEIVFGTRRADTIVTGDGDDIIFAGKGDDDITTNGGDDVIFAGKGDDTVDAGDGDDVVFGGKGNDDIDGGAGNDVIFGGKGSDNIDGGEGDDVIFGGRGSDTINVGDGNDVVFAGSGNDTVTVDFNPGDHNFIHGGRGYDTLVLNVTQDQANDAAIMSALQNLQYQLSCGTHAQSSTLGLSLFSIENLVINIVAQNQVHQEELIIEEQIPEEMQTLMANFEQDQFDADKISHNLEKQVADASNQFYKERQKLLRMVS